MFKLRGSSYIKSGRDFYFARVDFEYNQFVEELWSHKLKKEASGIPPGLIGKDAKKAWGEMGNDRNSHFDSSFIDKKNEDEIKAIFARNCVIYFPSNRFEEPAWLNQRNLNTKANYMDITHLEGHTNRNIINYAPLLDNQNWLFDVVYDMVVLEIPSRRPGPAKINYEISLEIIQRVMNKYQNIRFGIGMRRNRPPRQRKPASRRKRRPITSWRRPAITSWQSVIRSSHSVIRPSRIVVRPRRNGTI